MKHKLPHAYSNDSGSLCSLRIPKRHLKLVKCKCSYLPQLPFQGISCVGTFLTLYILGIGRGIALKLAECGAKVVAISRTQEDLDSLKKQVQICYMQGQFSL